MTSVMIIGGTDSSGGAGLTRDTVVAQAFGCAVAPIVTAVTAQSHTQFFASQPLSAALVVAQIRAATQACPPAAVKIGMLATAELAHAVAEALGALSCPIVVDPVLKSTSGGGLMVGAFPHALLSRTTVITPNLPEAAALSGTAEAQTPTDIAAQARWFLDQGVQAALIKGGHATGDTVTDTLFTQDGPHAFTAPRVGATMRGTGCALATGIACGLAQGQDLATACGAAKAFVHAGFRAAPPHEAAPPNARAPYSGT